MHACIYTGRRNNSWCREMFPDLSPAELPLAGKCGCLYAVDLCSRLKVTDLLIADCYFSAELAIKLGDGSYWSMNLRYMASDAQRINLR